MCHDAYNMRKGDQNDPSAHNYFYIHVYEYWGNPSQIRSSPHNAEIGLDYAKLYWAAYSPGPAKFNCSACTPYDHLFVYEDTGAAGLYHSRVAQADVQLHSGAILAATENYAGGGGWHDNLCYTNACLVEHSDVYFGATWAVNCQLDYSDFIYAYAHEFGHVVGLADHSSGDIMMNNQWSINSCTEPSGHSQPLGHTGPTTQDNGTTPPCSTYNGIRCIYHWD